MQRDFRLKKKVPQQGKWNDFIRLHRLYKYSVHNKVQGIIEIACLPVYMNNLSEAHEIFQSINCMNKSNGMIMMLDQI